MRQHPELGSDHQHSVWGLLEGGLILKQRLLVFSMREHPSQPDCLRGFRAKSVPGAQTTRLGLALRKVYTSQGAFKKRPLFPEHRSRGMTCTAVPLPAAKVAVTSSAGVSSLRRLLQASAYTSAWFGFCLHLSQGLAMNLPPSSTFLHVHLCQLDHEAFL